MCVSFQGNIDMFRANQMIQNEARSADNGRSLFRTVTLYWTIWLAPFGRSGKRSFAVLRLLGRTGHSLHGAPRIKRLLLVHPTAFRFAEYANITLEGYWERGT